MVVGAGQRGVREARCAAAFPRNDVVASSPLSRLVAAKPEAGLPLREQRAANGNPEGALGAADIEDLGAAPETIRTTSASQATRWTSLPEIGPTQPASAADAPGRATSR